MPYNRNFKKIKIFKKGRQLIFLYTIDVLESIPLITNKENWIYVKLLKSTAPGKELMTITLN